MVGLVGEGLGVEAYGAVVLPRQRRSECCGVRRSARVGFHREEFNGLAGDQVVFRHFGNHGVSPGLHHAPFAVVEIPLWQRELFRGI